jgi:hypothetical protein
MVEAALFFLEVVQTIDDFFYRQIVVVQQSLDRDLDPLERFGDDLQQYLHDLCFGDASSKHRYVVGQPRDVHGEVIDSFAVLEVDI